MTTIIWSPPSEDDLRKLDEGVRRRIDDAIERYALLGEGDVIALRGPNPLRRLRIGKWRVLLRPNEARTTLEVVRVLPRDKAYRDI